MSGMLNALAKFGKDAIAAANSEDRRRLMPVVRSSDVDHTDDDADDDEDDYYCGSESDYSLGVDLSARASLGAREMDILEMAEEDLEEHELLDDPEGMARLYDEAIGDIGVPRQTVKRTQLLVRGVYSEGQSVVYAPLGIAEIHEIALKKVKLKRPTVLTRPWHAVHVSLVKVITPPADPTKDTASASSSATAKASTKTESQYFDLGERALVRRETSTGDSGQFDACHAIGVQPFDCVVPALVNLLSGSTELNACIAHTADGTGKQSWIRSILTFTILAEYAYAHPAERDAIEQVLVNHGHMYYFVPADLGTRVRWHSFHKYSPDRADSWYVKFERADDRPFVAGEDESWSVELELEATYNVAN